MILSEILQTTAPETPWILACGDINNDIDDVFDALGVGAMMPGELSAITLYEIVGA